MSLKHINNEIKALLSLIDDPDDEVYTTVVDKLIGYGHDIIEPLENLWEVTSDSFTQNRIEHLIHRVHFQDLQLELLEWSKLNHPDFLTGAIIVAKFRYPALKAETIYQQFDKMRKNVWLELNPYLSPIEQVNVLNSMLYNYYKFQGQELTKRELKHFFINDALESHKANSFVLGIIYLALCEVLDIPIFAIDIPRQFILGYLSPSTNVHGLSEIGNQHIQFYIDPLNGTIFSQKDVDVYMKKLNIIDVSRYLVPISNQKVISKMIEELALCYRYQKQEDLAEELSELMALLKDV